jgi:hypothetical protein
MVSPKRAVKPLCYAPAVVLRGSSKKQNDAGHFIKRIYTVFNRSKYLSAIIARQGSNVVHPFVFAQSGDFVSEATRGDWWAFAYRACA